MVAIVIDLGQLRATRRNNQSMADLALLAGGIKLGEGNPQAACEEAWLYLKANATDMPVAAASPCGAMPTTTAGCPSGIATTNASASPYTIQFKYPVSNAEIADSRFASTGFEDGQACQRMSLAVTRDRTTLFAGVVGRGNLSTTSRAVMRPARDNPIDKPSLWLLDPTGCTSLNASGGSKVNVGTATNPGLITIDSDGSKTSNPDSCNTTSNQTINASGSGTSITAIPTSGASLGAISLFAMQPGTTKCNDPGNERACSNGDVASGRVTPQPMPRSQRATRAPVDYQFNCRPDADGNPATSAYPIYHAIVDIPDCPSSSTPAYIDQLRAFVGTSGAPPGFTTWTGGCTPNTLPAVTGNYFVDCPTFNPRGIITFNGNVVFRGGISLNAGGGLIVNPANTNADLRTQQLSCDPPTSDPPVAPVLCPQRNAPDAAYVYMRNGDISMSGGLITLTKTMLYQHNGIVSITGGAPPVWTSPDAGAFKGLSLWSEKAGVFNLQGGSSLNLEGTYFTPEAAPFKLTGGGSFLPLQAQFIAYHLEISGGGVLNLEPLTTKGVSVSDARGVLIR